MKRLSILISLLVFLFACTTEQAPEPTTWAELFSNNTWTPELMKGQVKSYEVKAYLVTEEDGNYIQGEALSDSMRKAMEWARDCAVYFDENGMVLKTVYMLEGGKVDEVNKTMINEEGNYEGLQQYRDDTLRSEWDVIYDPGADGQLVITGLRQYRGDSLFNSYNFTRDENGFWIAGQWINSKGEEGWKHEFTRDENGLVLKRVNTGPEGELSWSEYSYDENGFMISWKSVKSDSTEMNITQKYPELDEKGNWTTMISYKDGELEGMDIRTIEYYEAE